MTLSISMIVKNEEKYIYDCLQSLKDVADEIVIVDTGSTDETISAIKTFDLRYGGKYNFKFKWTRIVWQNDFAQARNESLKHCTGDWILFIDADERLDARFIDQINATKKIKENFAYHVIVRSFGNIQPVARQPRLFRNNKNLKFVNAIHEQIGPSLIENKYKFFLSSIVINHIGYDVDESVIEQKAKRNLEILQQLPHIDDGSEYHLAECHVALDNYTESLRHLRNAAHSDKLSHHVRSHTWVLMAQIYIRHNTYDFAKKCLEWAIHLYPNTAEAYFVYGQLMSMLGKHEEAVHAFQRATKNNKIDPMAFLKIIYDKNYLQDALNSANEKLKTMGV